MLCFEQLMKVEDGRSYFYQFQHRKNDMFVFSLEISSALICDRNLLIEFAEWAKRETTGMVSFPLYLFQRIEDEETEVYSDNMYISFTDLTDVMLCKLKFYEHIVSGGVFVENEDSLSGDFFHPIQNIEDLQQYRPNVKIPAKMLETN